MEKQRIPVSITLQSIISEQEISKGKKNNSKVYDKKRLLKIAILSILIASCVSIIARLLIYLIDFITNVAFFGNLSINPASPIGNTLGFAVIFIPALGGLLIGLMAYYGSKAIRGHGIPEAMEQILINESKIKPSITYLKPISSAISIGTGGPFGAEGPIIATGGALGSTIGQLIKITPNERKILLAAGATAGMSAIFGSPLAAILLAIELLLFEFSARSFIPVALACITGAAGHHLLFEPGFVFPIANAIEEVSNYAILSYGVLGIVIGLASVLVTKMVYFIEDSFEKLPIHWAWWPALGGLIVGTIGYFSPNTLGVGYSNITNLLSGTLTLNVILSLCFLKFISWAISLGSGTSGGTLAPLLTIGGAAGSLLGSIMLYWFPDSGITIPLSALVGMSAMFAGASRAFLTSIVFALETTGQSNALLPLITTCTTAYVISYFFMGNTIMTEKIARRGVHTPNSYEPDILEKLKVKDVIQNNLIQMGDNIKIFEARGIVNTSKENKIDFILISNDEGDFVGILSSMDLFNCYHDENKSIIELAIKKNLAFIMDTDDLRMAVEKMAKNDNEKLVIIDAKTKAVAGVLSYSEILSVYKFSSNNTENAGTAISLKRQRLKVIISRKKWMSKKK